MAVCVPPDKALPNPHCPLCGEANGCAVAASGSLAVDCWCRNEAFPPALLRAVPVDRRGSACICLACARKFSEREAQAAAE